MKLWKDSTHWAALDWAKDYHDVVVADRQGNVVADFRTPTIAPAGSSSRKSCSALKLWLSR